MRSALAYALAAAGDRNGARDVLEEIEKDAKTTYISPYVVAVAYAGLDDEDRAFESLDQAYRDRDPGMAFIATEPFFDRLRSDRRFTGLLKRMDLR
jgi:hypothetical protein